MRLTKIIFIIILSLVTFSQCFGANSYAEDEKRVHADLARSYLEDCLEIQKHIQELEMLDKQLVTLSTAGKLNIMLKMWGENLISKGKITQDEFSQIVSLAMLRLTELAEITDLPQAAKCHLGESIQIEKIRSGLNPPPVQCRQDAYSEALRLEATGVYGERADKLGGLSYRWSRATINYCRHAAWLAD